MTDTPDHTQECHGLSSAARRAIAGAGIALGVCAMILLSGCQTADVAGKQAAVEFSQIETAAGDPTALAAYSQAAMMAPRHTARGFKSSNPDTLLRLTRGDVASALGAPSIRRNEPPAEIWQYKTGKCVLDVYFYAAGPSTHPDASEVSYFEMRRPEKLQIGSLTGEIPETIELKSERDQKACLKAVLDGPALPMGQERADGRLYIPGGVI